MKTMAAQRQVEVWAIQALLVDDKPRTFAEIEQHVGFDPEDALLYMIEQGRVTKIKVETVTFWQRKVRRR